MSNKQEYEVKKRHSWIDSDLPLNKVVLLLAWPVMAQMMLQTLAQVVDMAMVGRLGQEAIAGIGLSFRPLFVAMSIFLGLGTATTALVARSIGAGKEDEARKAAAQSFMTGSVLAIALAIFVFFGARMITVFMGATGGVVDNGIIYLQGYSPGMVFAYVGILVTASLRGAGDTRTPFVAGIVDNVFNVIANYCLIFGHFGFPALGVLGAAIATSISRLISLVIMLYVLTKGSGGLHITAKALLTIDFTTIKRLFRIGIPAALERLAQSVSLMLTTKIVAILGTTAIAVTTLSSNIEQLSFMPAIGFSVAAATLVGQNLGAKRPEQAEASGWSAAKLAVLLMGFMGGLFIVIPSLFIKIYTTDPEVIKAGSLVLRVVGIAQIPQALAFAISGALRGAGATKPVLYLSVVGNFLIRLGLTWLFITQLHWGLWSVYVAVIIDWSVRSLLMTRIFRKGDWKTLQI